MQKITGIIDTKINKIKLIEILINNISIVKKVLLAVAIFIPVYIYFNINDAKDYGTLAINLLFLSLVISPLGKIFKNNLIKFLMLIRGEIGKLMASAALAHGVGILSNKMLQGALSHATLKDMFTNYLGFTLGITALLLTMPLLITSNLYFRNKMGMWWFKLHKLAYAIFILGALHGSFIKGGVSIENSLSAIYYFVAYGLIIVASKKLEKK